MPVETEFDTLVTDIKFLEKETSQTNECLRATLVATLRARASMLELFAAPKRSMLVLESGLSAVAQAVLRIQDRDKSPATS